MTVARSEEVLLITVSSNLNLRPRNLQYSEDRGDIRRNSSQETKRRFKWHVTVNALGVTEIYIANAPFTLGTTSAWTADTGATPKASTRGWGLDSPNQNRIGRN